MNPIFLFEARRSTKHWLTYLIAVILLFIGIFCGYQFNFRVGDGIYLNSPYTIGFMTGLLSLSVIFFAILFSGPQLFKDWDSKFDGILFSFPISKWKYLSGKFYAYFLQTLISFGLLMLGFIIGQNMRSGSEIQNYFNPAYYLYPLLIFGCINSLLVCSFLFFISFITKKKLLVVVGGLLLYVLYMVILLFSNSPFMVGSIPQSLQAQQTSALIDPFGLSAYFFEAKPLTLLQKNTQLVPLSGSLLINRIISLILSGIFLALTYHCFSFSAASRRKIGMKNKKPISKPLQKTLKEFPRPTLHFGKIYNYKATLSFAKIDLLYLFKSITMVAVSILLLFNAGMEMYAEIEKGIRLPQKYASSGLMASTISENFHLFGLLIAAYFINDLYWRSRVSGFFMIENTVFFSKMKRSGHFLSVSIMMFFFTFLLILEGFIFQFFYDYFMIDWNAYLGVILFNTFPLILFSGFLTFINDRFKNRFLALGVSVLAVFILTGPVSKKIIPFPLFRILSDYKGGYSDFNGYGIYTGAFAERILFGAALITFLWMICDLIKTKNWNVSKTVLSIALLCLGIFSGKLFMKGYIPADKETAIQQSVNYEKQFRKYEHLPQPSVTDIQTEIQMYPSDHSYRIQGKYIMVNETDQLIDRVLINFNSDLKIESAVFTSSSEAHKISSDITEIKLKKPLLPNETATLGFKLSYQWFAVNGHQSFNAIIENGSFMRISRYYPVLGYQKDLEIQDEHERKKFSLGKLTELKKLEAPEVFRKDFINLNMTVSTEKSQTAVGTGDLIKKWSDSDRNYYQYKADHIPFRFAVSSAAYAQKSIIYKGIKINILYNEKHFENVNHLIENAKITLDYCRQNFGEYPFKTISFAEISSFTKGFAATAYPSAIFMPEDMVFHANIHADKEQDVINELTGHELSHLWWGNSQIDPDEREGAVMLTETLAMYTEMMLYKKMHGRKKMLERIEVHQQIYDNEKGLSKNQPIYKVTAENSHISYSKGAVAMVKLSELIGEEKLNKALRSFLQNNTYPKKPSSLDLLTEFYKVCPDRATRKQVDTLFKEL